MGIRMPKAKEASKFGKLVAPAATLAGAAIGSLVPIPGVGTMAGASLGASLGGAAGALTAGVVNKDVGQVAQGVAQGTAGGASAMDRRLDSMTPKQDHTDDLIAGLEAVPGLPKEERSAAAQPIIAALQNIPPPVNLYQQSRVRGF